MFLLLLLLLLLFIIIIIIIIIIVIIVIIIILDIFRYFRYFVGLYDSFLFYNSLSFLCFQARSICFLKTVTDGNSTTSLGSLFHCFTLRK